MGATTIQLFGRRKCRDTQKAQRFFKDRGIAYQFVDLNVKPMSPGELKSVVAVIDAEKLIDSDSAAYRKRGMAWMQYEPQQELAEHPQLMRTPVVRCGADATVGFDPDGWSRLAGIG